jgi:hypothetical protein
MDGKVLEEDSFQLEGTRGSPPWNQRPILIRYLFSIVFRVSFLYVKLPINLTPFTSVLFQMFLWLRSSAGSDEMMSKR